MNLGKRPARIDRRTLRYRDYRVAGGTVPAQAHWGHDLAYAMDSNDALGDCAEAAYAHQVQVWDARAGRDYPVTGADVAGAYSAITGYVPGDPSTDRGTVLLDALAYWRATGLAGRKIAAYAAVDPLDAKEVAESVAWYGGLYIGLQLPLSAQDQAGSEWALTSGPGSAPGSWGGHCVPVTGFDTGRLWCVTWGAIQAMTWEFFQACCDEAYVLLAPDWLEASGQSPSNLAWGQLMAALANL